MARPWFCLQVGSIRLNSSQALRVIELVMRFTSFCLMCDCYLWSAVISERNSELTPAERLYSKAVDLGEEPIRTFSLMNRGALNLRMRNVQKAISDFSMVTAERSKHFVKWAHFILLQSIQEKTAGSMVFYNRGLCYSIDDQLEQVTVAFWSASLNQISGNWRFSDGVGVFIWQGQSAANSYTDGADLSAATGLHKSCRVFQWGLCNECSTELKPAGW